MPSSSLLASSGLYWVYFLAYSSPGKYGCHGAGTPWRASPSPRNDRLLDLVAVDGMRQRDPELLGREELGDLRVRLVGLVEGDHGVGAAEGRPGDDAVLPALLVLLEDRVVRHLDVPLLHVHLAGDRGQVERLDVGEEGEADLVEVGQLVAVGIDADEVRIPPEGEDLVAHSGGRHPGRHRRPLRVLERRVAGGEELGPRLEARRLDELVDVFLLRVLGMELLQVVGRQEDRVGPIAAVLVGQRRQEEGGRLLVAEANGLRVHLLDRRRPSRRRCAATPGWRA